MKNAARALTSDAAGLMEPPGFWPMLVRPVTGDPILLAAAVLAVAVLLFAGHGFVAGGGGTKFSGTFALLVPVLLAASVFHLPGGIVTGVVAGLVLGPSMPLDVAADVPQPTENWVLRLCWFAGLGAFVGLLSAVPRWRKAVSDHRARVDEMSGLPTPDAVRIGAPRSLVAYTLAVDFGMYERLLDTHGRVAANAFVRVVAAHLRDAIGDTVAGRAVPLTRVRSDVFGLLLPDDPGLLSETVDAVLDRLPRWVTLETVSGDEAEPLVVPVTAHVGIADIAAADLDDFDVFRNGIRAARVARETRRPVTRYDRSSTPVARENVQMAAELLQALERDELFLVFQPKLILADGTVSTAEALLRWQSPRRGLVPPSRFVPVAEQSSLINALTDWVLEHAVDTVRQWRAAGRELRLSVNLSGRDLLDDRMLDRLRQLPERTGIAASAFSLEITETAFIGDLEPIGRRLAGLSEAGYDILVDDFGTGCSSFAYLHRLPVDGVKIDRTFVSAVTTDATAEQLVTSMLDWCHRIGKRTVAEGVEDEATVEALRRMGCEEIQGYWVSRPLSAADLQDWLRRRDGAAVAPDGVV